MPGPISRWILSRVVASGLAFEEEAIGDYRAMREKLGVRGACGEHLESSLCHLLEEEEAHKRVLTDAAAGRLSEADLDGLLDGHAFPGLDSMQPLSAEEQAVWGDDLARSLEQEEKTWIFYGNLRRMSKIPAVKKAFEVLAGMEKEHVDILRRLLGKG
jgi:rubrerythrin